MIPISQISVICDFNQYASIGASRLACGYACDVPGLTLLFLAPSILLGCLCWFCWVPSMYVACMPLWCGVVDVLTLRAAPSIAVSFWPRCCCLFYWWYIPYWKTSILKVCSLGWSILDETISILVVCSPWWCRIFSWWTITCGTPSIPIACLLLCHLDALMIRAPAELLVWSILVFCVSWADMLQINLRVDVPCVLVDSPWNGRTTLSSKCSKVESFP